MEVGMKIEGVNELKQQFEKLSRIEQTGIIENATTIASRIFLIAARSNILGMHRGGIFGGGSSRKRRLTGIGGLQAKQKISNMASMIANALEVHNTGAGKHRYGLYGTDVRIKPGAAKKFKGSAAFKSLGKKKEWFIPMAMEYGHIGRGGKRVPAHPFMRNAYDDNVQEVGKTTEDMMADAIEKDVREGGYSGVPNGVSIPSEAVIG